MHKSRVNRVKQRTNAEPQRDRIDMIQQDQSQWDADRCAQRERPDCSPVQRLSQFQNAVTLREANRSLAISAAVCIGVMMCSHTPNTTRPIAKPERPLTKPPAKAAKEKE